MAFAEEALFHDDAPARNPRSWATRNPSSEHRAPGRRRRRSGGTRWGSNGGGRGNEMRAWLGLIDAVLKAVEETAWAARDLADSAREAWTQGGREVASARDEAALWSEDVSRMAQTGFMLARTAAGYRLHRFRAAFVSERRARSMLDELHAKSARRFYEVSAVHGGAFMKVGQLLSARADLLPAAWIRELARLQDAAPEVDMDSIRAVVEGDLGKPLEELFASFDETPVGAASIGQVHRAILHDGRVVAVKVQRPHVDLRVRMDLDWLETFVESLRPSLPDTDYDTIVREVRQSVLAETDYVAEARTTATLAAFFASHPDVVVPRTVPELCSAHVLTTEFVDGKKITVVLDALEARAAAGDSGARGELSRVLGHLLEAYFAQVLRAGVFQADPHPGNLLVTKDGAVVILDMGGAQTVPDAVRDRYLALVRAVRMGDADGMTRLFDELGFRTRSGKPDTLHVFAEALLGELRQALASRAVEWPTRERMAERARELLGACADDPVIELPSEFIMIARVFGTLGGLFSRYRPDVEFSRFVLPVLGGLF